MKKYIIYIVLASACFFTACDKFKKENKEEKLNKFIENKNFVIAPSISTLELDYVIFKKIDKVTAILPANLYNATHNILMAFNVTVKPNISLENIKSKIDNDKIIITYEPKIIYELLHKQTEATILSSKKATLATSITNVEVNNIKNDDSVRDYLLAELKKSPIEELVHTTFQNYMISNCVAMGFNEKNIKFSYESKDLVKLKN